MMTARSRKVQSIDLSMTNYVNSRRVSRILHREIMKKKTKKRVANQAALVEPINLFYFNPPKTLFRAEVMIEFVAR